MGGTDADGQRTVALAHKTSEDKTYNTISNIEWRVEPEDLVDDGVEVSQRGSTRELLPRRVGGRELSSELFPQSYLGLGVSSELDQSPLWTKVSVAPPIISMWQHTVRLATQDARRQSG